MQLDFYLSIYFNAKIIVFKRYNYVKYNKVHCLKKNRYKLVYKYPMFIFHPSYLKELLNIIRNQ